MSTHDPTPPFETPLSWTTLEILNRRIQLELSVYNCVFLHLACLYVVECAPLDTQIRRMGERMLSDLERGFAKVGLEPPPGGWRAPLPVPQVREARMPDALRITRPSLN